MLNSDYGDQNCSVARALEVVGERWTLLIIRQLLRGPHRFAELERELEVSKNVLTTRLEKLVEQGMVKKERYSETRDWYRYKLTRKGADFFPAISALMAWGDKYAAPDGPPMIFEHECGHPTGHQVVCTHCGEELRPRAVRLVAGPGATA